MSGVDFRKTVKNLLDNKTGNFDNESPISEENGCYGELVLLGYNGCFESGRANSKGRKHRSKMVFKRREQPSGVKKGNIVEIKASPKQSQVVQDTTRHVVSYSYNKSHTVLVEYIPDHTKDMFQVGRSSEEQIDFTIVDTWLASGASQASARSGISPGAGPALRPISSTISRYACRILADRDQPNKAYVYAAGFDSLKNIFLGEKATKWQKKNGDFDGLTTNGVLVLHPNRCIEDDTCDKPEMFVWREVSVDGDIYSLRETRSSIKRGELISDETNQLQDGTLVDLCGATLLWRSAAGLSQSPSRSELERRLDELNAGKPQCPVNLNTLIIPRRKITKQHSSKQPYVYLNCGHVQGKHNWGVTVAHGGDVLTSFRCPICIVESDKIIQLTMGMESAFHLNSDNLDYAFNPCGHVASLATVRYWSRIPLPQGTNSFCPVCPFCTTILSTSKPYVRLIFQDHCYDT